jgi:hypothetical protein
LGLSLKSLLPVAGAAAGFFGLGPIGGSLVNAALGSGIGTLLAGGDLKDAVKNAAIAGIGGAGLQSAGIGPTAASTAQTAAATQAAQAEKAIAAMEGTKAAVAKEAAKKGIMSYLTPGNVLLGTTLLGALEEPEQEELTEEERRQRLTGERTDYQGNPNLVSRYDYSNEPSSTRYTNGILYAAQGGLIEGPGTGTSDSIPAMIYQNGVPVQEARLSHNEFVFTDKAVRGAGGPAAMYKMMKKYEAMA